MVHSLQQSIRWSSTRITHAALRRFRKVQSKHVLKRGKRICWLTREQIFSWSFAGRLLSGFNDLKSHSSNGFSWNPTNAYCLTNILKIETFEWRWKSKCSVFNSFVFRSGQVQVFKNFLIQLFKSSSSLQQFRYQNDGFRFWNDSRKTCEDLIALLTWDGKRGWAWSAPRHRGRRAGGRSLPWRWSSGPTRSSPRPADCPGCQRASKPTCPTRTTGSSADLSTLSPWKDRFAFFFKDVFRTCARELCYKTQTEFIH